MTHNFNIFHAKKYGLSEAIFLQNLIFWLRQNAANDRNLFEVDKQLYPELEGQLRYWTYNSVAAYSELFPYFSPKQVRNAIDSLLKQGVIIKGNYSENKYDRTNWYAVSDEQILEMDLPKRANGVAAKGECIQIKNQMKINNNSNSEIENKTLPLNTEKEDKESIRTAREKSPATPAKHTEPMLMLFEELFNPQTNAGAISKALGEQGLGILDLDETKVYLRLHSYENTAQLKKVWSGWSSHIARVIKILRSKYGDEAIQNMFGKNTPTNTNNNNTTSNKPTKKTSGV